MSATFGNLTRSTSLRKYLIALESNALIAVESNAPAGISIAFVRRQPTARTICSLIESVDIRHNRKRSQRTHFGKPICSRRNFVLPEAIAQRASAVEERYKEIIDSFSSCHGASDAAGKELSSLARISKLYGKLGSLEREHSSLHELFVEAKEMKDEEMQAECIAEVEQVKKEIEKIEKSLILAVLPKDEDDVDVDAILEIRSGAGGDEASLFSAELLTAYEGIAKQMGWTCEMLSISKTDLGGVREASLSITGSSGSGGHHSFGGDDDAISEEEPTFGPYGFFKWESGVHRVQRVPINDAKIHTSTASVAVLPAPSSSNKESSIPPSELRIETMRASGAGGQHVNTTESAVRITHIPTGITATIQDERSQHKNKAKALRLIEARVADVKKAEEMAKRGEARRSLMGGGTRSERIRTYNFPQDRVTDHRVSVTIHGVEGLLSAMGEGSLVATFAPLLRDVWREEALIELEEEIGD